MPLRLPHLVVPRACTEAPWCTALEWAATLLADPLQSAPSSSSPAILHLPSPPPPSHHQLPSSPTRCHPAALGQCLEEAWQCALPSTASHPSSSPSPPSCACPPSSTRLLPRTTSCPRPPTLTTSTRARLRRPMSANGGASRVSAPCPRQHLSLTLEGAIINGTLYLYGGRATTSSQQTSNEWSASPPPPLHQACRR